MRYRILPYRQGSASAKALATALGGKVLKLEGSTFIPRYGDVIIGWGDTTHFGDHLNSAAAVKQASNKREFFQLMYGANLQDVIPRFWINREEIPNDAFPVVCRTVLAGHSGDGIVISPTRSDLVSAPLYVEYIKKQEEYRVHVGKRSQCNKIRQRLSCEECGYPESEAAGSGDHLGPCDRGLVVISLQRKARRLECPTPNWQIRNHANGFVFKRNGVSPPSEVCEVAKKALSATLLDFGGVDVIWNAQKRKAYVLEINTACGLEGTTVEDYAAFFRSLTAT